MSYFWYISLGGSNVPKGVVANIGSQATSKIKKRVLLVQRLGKKYLPYQHQWIA